MANSFPDAFFTSISLNDEKFELKKDSIVCFVGGNGVGKSAVLSALLGRVTDDDELMRECILSGMDFNVSLSQKEFEDFLGEVGTREESGISWYGARCPQHANTRFVDHYFQGLNKNLNTLFVLYASTRQRLTSVDAPSHLHIGKQAARHPFHVLYAEPEKEALLNRMSERIFGRSVFINPGAGSVLPLHIAPNSNAVPNLPNRGQNYANEVGKFPEISSDGDGVQSTIGLLAILVASHHSCLIIDEPDVFLHPPQAFQMGKSIAELSTSRQVFLATHSHRLLQGLIDKAADRVTLVKLSKSSKDFSFKVVSPNTLLEIQSDPLLKYSGVADCLFYSRVLLCEDYNDCYFYSAALDQIGSSLASESLWIGVGGKERLAKFAQVCAVLGVMPICVADFDLLAPQHGKPSHGLLGLLAAFGEDVDWYSRELSSLYRAVSNNGKINWELVKDIGIQAFSFDQGLHKKVLGILNAAKASGLVINPFGEMESLAEPKFDKSIDGITGFLKRDIQTDPGLHNAKVFLETLNETMTKR